MDLRGLEPLTPCMPCRCATSCATAPLLPRITGVTTRGILATRCIGCEIGGPIRRQDARVGGLVDGETWQASAVSELNLALPFILVALALVPYANRKGWGELSPL